MRRLHGLLLLGALLLATAVPAAAQVGRTVSDVVIEGNVGVDHRLLMANLGTKPGQPFDRVTVDEDIRRLHDEFGVVVENASIDEGGVVRLELKRIRQYDVVEFEGNDRFNDKSLRTTARLREGKATPDEVAKARSLIEDHYRRKGHHFVQVEVRQMERDDGRTGAKLFVFEGPEVEIDDLTIEGLTALDEGDARSLLRSRKGFWGTLLGKDFVREDVDRDVVVLETFVRGEGYKDARVALDELRFSADREEVDVNLLVVEGPRYFVRSLRVEGAVALDEATLLQDADLAPGRPYRAPDLGRLVRAIEDAYGRKGYIDVEVQPEELYDLDEPLVDVVLRIDEGRQKKVRDVIVRGNVNTRDGVVRRYLTLYPGDIVDTAELRYSEDALVALDYFVDLAGTPKVRVTTSDTPDDEYVDVVVEVDDSSSGLFSFIVGAGSDSGLFGGITIDKKNFDITRGASGIGAFFTEFFGRGEAFHGGGQRLYFEILPGTETTDLTITFVEPWLDESSEKPWGFTTELYSNSRFFSEYDRERLGAAVLFDHRLSRETSVSIGPRLERVDISSVDDTEADAITGERTDFAKAEGQHDRHVVEGSWRFREVDSLWEPTAGVIHGLRLEQVGGPLGGDVDAVRAQWTSEWFSSLGEDDDGNVRVLNPRLALGVVEATRGEDSELPFFERWFVGGATGPFAVRGFDYQGVGPHQEIKNTPLGPVLVETDGDAVGGDLAGVASVQALFPLVTQWNPFRDREETIVKGVLFVDAGNLVAASVLGDLLSDVRVATGAGLRMRLPALGGITVMLDYAVVLSEQDGDETRALSFELSRRF